MQQEREYGKSYAKQHHPGERLYDGRVSSHPHRNQHPEQEIRD